MMRTTIAIDDVTMSSVIALTGQKSHTAAIRTALDQYLRLARKERLLALRGKVDIADNWRALRDREVIDSAAR
jgi:hypothetical protein